MVALKTVLMLPVLCAGIRVNDEALKLNENWFGFGGKKEENATAGQEAEPEPPADDDACHQASPGSRTRNSAWRRTHNCKCPAGQRFQCGDRDCEETGRYFKVSQVKEGCACASCSTECGEIVTDAVPRKSAWRRSSLKCKCEKGFAIRGQAEACNQGEADNRYFARKDLRNQGCYCEATPEADAAPGEGAGPQPEPKAPASTPSSPGSDEQGEAPPSPARFEDQFTPAPSDKKASKEEGAATRGAGGLAFSALLLVGAAFAS